MKATVALLGLDEETFVAEVLAAMPPRPENYREIIAANLHAAADPDPDVATLEVGANNCAATVAHP